MPCWARPWQWGCPALVLPLEWELWDGQGLSIVCGPREVFSGVGHADSAGHPGTLWPGHLVFRIEPSWDFFRENCASDAVSGLEFFGACLPVALGGLIFGIVQGRICAGGLSLIAKKPNDLSRSVILAIMMEFYAILALLASFLMLNHFQF